MQSVTFACSRLDLLKLDWAASQHLFANTCDEEAAGRRPGDRSGSALVELSDHLELIGGAFRVQQPTLEDSAPFRVFGPGPEFSSDLSPAGGAGRGPRLTGQKVQRSERSGEEARSGTKPDSLI